MSGVVAALLGCPANATGATDGFESGSFGAWSTARLPTPSAAVVQSVITRSGGNAARLELLPGDRMVFGGYRAELADRFIARHGSEARYHFSILLPATTRLHRGQGCVVVQFQDQSSEIVPNRFDKNEHSPPLAFRYRDNGDMKITVQHYKDAQSPEGLRKEIARIQGFTLGTWHDFRVHVRWSQQGGLVEIWHRDVANGQERKLADYKGPVGFPPEQPPTGEGPYFKVGPYCATSPAPAPLTVYFDDYVRSGG